MIADSIRTACGRMPWGLVGMLGLVAAAESFVARNPIGFNELCRTCWERSARAADTEAAGRRILCLGDSMMKNALIPKVLAKRTGRSAYNLAVDGGLAPASYTLLRRALAAGPPPEAVIFELGPHMMRLDPLTSDLPWSALIGPLDAWELAHTSGDPRVLDRVIAERSLPSVRGRHQARDWLRAALAGRPYDHPSTLAYNLRNWEVNDGAAIHQAHLYRELYDLTSNAKLLQSWWCTPVNRIYLERLLRLTEARGIRAYWLLPPYCPEILDQGRASGAEAALTALVRKVQSRHTGLVILDARSSGYESAATVDGVHLNRRGAATLSTDIAALVADDLARPPAAGRWVTLPPYRDVPLSVAVEDMLESIAALRERATAAATALRSPATTRQ